MKKFSYFTFIVFAAMAIVSCAKTNKGKITNSWRVVGYYEQVSDPDTTYSYSTGDAPGNSNQLTIDKDGTWTWNKVSTSSGVVFAGTVFLHNKESATQQGTWSFIQKAKGDDFKKNERLLFNILSESTSSSQTGGGGNPVFPDTTISSSQTWLTGEKTILFTVVKSSRDELQLESKSSHTNSSGQVSSRKIKVILEAKK